MPDNGIPQGLTFDESTATPVTQPATEAQVASQAAQTALQQPNRAVPTPHSTPTGLTFDESTAEPVPQPAPAKPQTQEDINRIMGPQTIAGQLWDRQQKWGPSAETVGAVKGIWSDTLDAVKGAATALNPKPQNEQETDAFNTTGIGGMLMYRMLAGLGHPAMDSLQLHAAIHDINQSKDPMGTYLQVAQKTASQGAGAALTALATEGVVKAVPKVASVVSDTAGKAVDVSQQVLKGEKVAQPAAQTALRTVAGNTASELRESLTTPIEAAEKSADALYKTIDDATGTDIKGLGKKLKDTNFKIRMSTNPTEEAAWEAKRADLEDTITDALKQAKDAGVPDDQLAKADAQFKQMSALSDVEKKVFKNVNVIDPTTGDINVNSAVKELQKLQDNTKYGNPRLEQALGKDNTFLEDMKAANRLGIEAINKQQLLGKIGKALRIAGYSVGGVVGTYELLK